MRFTDAVRFIRNEETNKSKPGLDRVNYCLGLLKHPEASQRIIHVVGTNGKGSTATMITNILVAAGYHVGTMISPALHGVTDYYRIDGKPITTAQFVNSVETLKSALRPVEMSTEAKKDLDPTEFERAVCVGLILFKMENCDFTVLEAGMGGINDATNVGQGCLTVVTKIALDHMQYLGDTLEAITQEKLGIASAGEPIVLGVNSTIVTDTATRWCKTNRHELYQASIADDSFFPNDRAMIADYQKVNIATAQKAVEVLSGMSFEGAALTIDDFAMEAGIRSANLPYRFDVRKTDPYLIFDGGHNPDCIDALCRSLRQFSGDTKYYIVTGVLADKDYPAMYEMLQQYALGFVCITPPSNRALPAKDLCDALRKFEKPAEVAESMVDAVKRIKELRKKGYPVLVTGSLYIMPEIVAAWNKTR